jgi:hypothetical protein
MMSSYMLLTLVHYSCTNSLLHNNQIKIVYSKSTSLAREAIGNTRIVAGFRAEDRVSIRFVSELKKTNKQPLLRGSISG